MSVKNPKDPAASIRQKLLNYAKASKQDFQRVIDCYAIECILDRLANSPFADKFLLKGALVFTVWNGWGKRPTRDIDLLGKGSNETESVVLIFKDILSIAIEEDCILFFPERIQGTKIKEDEKYEGVRIVVPGSISGAIFNVQIDIGFGDIVTPVPKHADFPRMLQMRPISLLIYPPETVFAEKLEAIITRGMLNSRMKDYYDLVTIIHDKLYSTESLVSAIKNTFKQRKTVLIDSCPIGLSEEFARDRVKIAQWKGFLTKSGLKAGELSEVITSVRLFIKGLFKLPW